MNIRNKALKLHEDNKGKLEVKSKVSIKDSYDLSLAYTPGVAEVCKEIYQNKENAYKYTSKQNMVAVISDGTAVLGLGDIGPLAAMPVMEGKAVLFKEFADVDAIPIVLDTQDEAEIIKTIINIAPSFGGINLEDIKAPKCFSIEQRLKEVLDIPVFHDDQHGTAIVVGAALINALKIVKKDIKDILIVINGLGSAGVAISKFLLSLGVNKMLLCDRQGILSADDKTLNFAQKELALITNKENKKGALSDALVNADVFIGVSAGGIVSKKMIQKMNQDAIVFALANPVPEISRKEALEAGARIVGTGRSNEPNQINNVLVFPGLFKGILESRAKQFTDEMFINAAYALAGIIDENKLKEDYIIPNAFDRSVAGVVSNAVIKTVKKEA